jgi:cytochrome c oxidase subunit 2
VTKLIHLSLLLIVLSGCGGVEEAGPSGPAAQGKELAESKACVSCHSMNGDQGVAPTWKGLYMSEVELSTGETVIADEEYLRRSMLEPTSQTVKGFQEGLMETVIKPNSLTDAEVRALIAYIRSLQ